MAEENIIISWNASEYKHEHKDADWFWGVGIIAVSIAVIAILTGNPLFGIVIIVAGIALFLHAIKNPETVAARATSRGLHIGNTLLPYTELESFWIHNTDEHSHIILKSKRVLTPRIVIPTEAAKEREIRSALAPHLPEKQLAIPLSHQLLEFLGL